MADISQEARDFLAAEYMNGKMPWFAHDIKNSRGKQFDKALRVITRLLNK